MTLQQAYDVTPPADGKWSWYSALAAQTGVCASTVYNWHRREGLPPKYRLPSKCRWCGSSMSATWSARVSSRLCFECCREAGRENG